MLQKVYDIAKDVCGSLGFELWGIDYPNGRNGVLRVYIESLVEDKPIDIDDCVAVSERISVLLDSLEELDFPYSLEISSPGLIRTIYYNEQYDRYKGKVLKLKLKNRIENSNLLVGKLVDTSDIGIVVEANNTNYTIEFNEIKKATIELL